MDAETKSNEVENSFSQEYKWKDLLYELFYEIKSEILGCKIEIDEEEYQENVRDITIPKLVDYLHESIKILVEKKMDDVKNKQKELDKKYYLNNVKNILHINEQAQYENIIRKLEEKERSLLKKIFKRELQKTSLENKISDYMDMEEEFEEMKTKLKYEEGRFLKNDRKDNEIVILRGENTNLKQSIKNLEEKIKEFELTIKSKEKKIKELQEDNKKIKSKFKEVLKQNELLNANCINININNNLNSNNKNSHGKINNLNIKSVDKKNILKNNNIFYKKINKKILSKADPLNYTNNPDRRKSELNNYYINNNKNNFMNNTVSRGKINFQYVNSRKINQQNFNEIHSPAFSNLLSINNGNLIQRNVLSGASSYRANSTKTKVKQHKIVNYKNFI